MRTLHPLRRWALLSLVLPFAFAACSKLNKEGPPVCGGPDSTVTTTKVIATGFNDPRGLKFGPDGYLYVAEAGIGGTHLSSCVPQVVPPVGPYMGSDTGARISRVGWDGVRTTFVDHLPSSTTAPGGGSAIQGIADVQFIGNTLLNCFTHPVGEFCRMMRTIANLSPAAVSDADLYLKLYFQPMDNIGDGDIAVIQLAGEPDPVGDFDEVDRFAGPAHYRPLVAGFLRLAVTGI